MALTLAFGMLALLAGMRSAQAQTQRSTDAPELALTSAVSMLALHSGATTRAPAAELSVGVEWILASGWGGALSYRGGRRAAGGDAIGVTTLVHRLQWGVIGVVENAIGTAAFEVGLHLRATNTRFKGQHGGGYDVFEKGLGGAFDTTVGLKITDRLSATVHLGAYQRQRFLDFTVGLGLRWNPTAG